jgi:hypothetical protein
MPLSAKTNARIQEIADETERRMPPHYWHIALEAVIKMMATLREDKEQSQQHPKKPCLVPAPSVPRRRRRPVETGPYAAPPPAS